MTRVIVLLSVIFVLSGAGYISKSIQRNSIMEPILDVRFGGLFRAISDILWIKFAQDIPFLLRVTEKQAELNYSRLNLAVRLYPGNLEAYRYGSLGLAIWGRYDLAERFMHKAIAMYPNDKQIKLTMLTLAMNHHQMRSLEYLNWITRQLIDDPIVKYFFVLKAKKEIELKRFTEAEKTLNELALIFPDEEGIILFCNSELKKLKSYAAGSLD